MDDAELAKDLEDGWDGAVGAEDFEDVGRVGAGAAGEAVLEQVDDPVGEVRQVGEGLTLDLAVLITEGGAEELGVTDLAVLDGLDGGDMTGGPC